MLGVGGHPSSLGRDTPPLLSPRSVLQGASAMAEKLSPSPGGAITPLQQMLASGTGAILTSLFGEEPGQRVGAAGRGGGTWLKDGVVSVTPLDVVKIRLQAQRTPFSKGNPARGRAGVCRHAPCPRQPASSPPGRPAWQRQRRGA